LELFGDKRVLFHESFHTHDCLFACRLNFFHFSLHFQKIVVLLIVSATRRYKRHYVQGELQTHSMHFRDREHQKKKKIDVRFVNGDLRVRKLAGDDLRRAPLERFEFVEQTLLFGLLAFFCHELR
jgi:hypothetical protein